METSKKIQELIESTCEKDSYAARDLVKEAILADARAQESVALARMREEFKNRSRLQEIIKVATDSFIEATPIIGRAAVIHAIWSGTIISVTWIIVRYGREWL